MCKLIRRTMGGQEFEIARKTCALWEIVKPASAKVDQAKIDLLAQQLSQLRTPNCGGCAQESAEYNGLRTACRHNYSRAADKSKLVSKVLLVGNPVDAMNPQGDRYVKAQDSRMVAVLPGSIVQRLIAEPQKFRDLGIGGFVTADKIIMEHGDRKITFQKEPTGWKVTEPIKTDAEDEDLRELHDQLAKLRANELVEDKPKDLAKYGLDKPIHWRVFNGGREEMHLLAGAR